jgi:hypothetical protein
MPAPMPDPILLGEEGDIEIDVKQIIFDPNNFRLKDKRPFPLEVAWNKFAVNSVQTTVADCLKDHYGIDELYSNMQNNGISFQDRIVVAEWTNTGKPSRKLTKNKKFVVLEGNRRVRAFQILRDNETLIHPKIKAQLKKIRAVEMVYTDIEKLKKRSKAMMAVRHLCGTKDWSPLSQAEACYEALQEYGSKSDAADSIGISQSKLTSDLNALALYNWLETNYNTAGIIPTDFAAVRLLTRSTKIKTYIGSSYVGIPPVATIGNATEMGHIIRKWKGHPTGKPDSDEVNGENELRDVEKIVDSGNIAVISSWEAGTLTTAKAVLQIKPDGGVRWPRIGQEFVGALQNIPSATVNKWGPSDRVLVKESQKEAKARLKDNSNFIDGLSVKKLRKMCNQFGLSTSGNKDDLKKRLKI